MEQFIIILLAIAVVVTSMALFKGYYIRNYGDEPSFEQICYVGLLTIGGLSLPMVVMTIITTLLSAF